MAKNSREGNRERAARRRTGLAARGLEQFQVIAPGEAKLLIRRAADLMTRETDPVEPRSALRQVGGANEPEPDGTPTDMVAELEAARKRIAEMERQAEARRIITSEATKRRNQTMEAELDAARAAVETEREKARETAVEAQEAARAAQEAKERTTEALQRAEKAEAAIRQAKTMPGIRGRLVRWLAGDVLPD
jgi:DNA repair exonuclease SbcCD ATPase subunit